MNKTLKHIILSAFLLMSVAAMAQTPPQHVTVRGNVFGGGNMAPVGRGTTVLIDQANAVIEGDVYGGGAKAEVDTLRKASPLPALAVGDSILVNILQGSIGGDIYGGGLGNADTAANVYGPVFVNIGSGTVDGAGFATSTSGAATLGGSVYGCNNLNGTPKDNVYVNIYQTAHDGTNDYPDPEPTLEQLATQAASTAFAITAVYGGGNKAAYDPEDNTKIAQVHVYACYNTIQTIYGGGNAADATKVGVTIDGGFFDRVFGGGNGYSETNNHGDPTAPNYNPGANITVSATTLIHGGLYRQVFGGSNQYGDVAGASLTIDKTSPCNTELIAEAFGGANEANITGNLTTTLACSSGSSGEIGNFYGGSNLADITGNVTLNVIGGTYTSVFGGSKGRAADNSVVPAITAKAANINGNVELNLHGGTMTNAFGGSDVNGNITGSITVNLNDTSTVCPLTVHNIYGAGRDAAYTPTTPEDYPEVNLINGTVSKVGNAEGNVFGGGLGETARVTSNPVVNLQGGTVAGTLFGGGSAAPVTGSPTVNANHGSAPVLHGGGLGTTAAVTGNPTVLFNKTADKTLTVTTVYGGGDAAPVEGNTTVTLTEGTLANAFGGGNVADITGTTLVTLQGATVSNIYGGGNQASVSSTSTVTLTSGTATTGVYGGCNASGTVGGAINVNVTGGTVGSADTHAYGVFGGGFGQSTATGDNVTVTIGDGTTTPTIYGDVYGGSAEGNVNDDIAEITKVWLKSGTVTGDIYGGGFGDHSSNALVNGSVQVVVDGGSMVTTNGNGGRIFGCNNANGTPKGPVTVEINSTDATVVDPVTGAKTYALQGVYGGGNLAHYNPTNSNARYPQVTVNGCASSIKDVFGGGNAAAVPYDTVVINGGDIDRVFAGGNGTSGAANVGYMNSDATPSSGSYGLGTANAIIKGGTVNQVFGGSNNSGTIRVNGSLNINKESSCDMMIGEVYGGGNYAPGAASTIIIGCTGSLTADHNTHPENIGTTLEGIGNVYGGANRANVSGNISLTIEDGIINNVFGGNNQDGAISGTITVNIEKKADPCGWYVGNVYGGGNLAAYQPTSAGSYPAVNIKNGTVSGNVFGGGLGATAKVYSNPVVTIGDLDHNAYVATVTGNVYGGGSAAMVGDDTPATASTNNTTVTIQKANSSVAKVFGGGMAAGVTGTTSVTITDGTVSAGLYGGCDASGTVVGNITVDANGGTIGTNDGNSDDGIFGGGYGSGTATSGNVAVTVDGSTIYGDVYGGSALGNVNNGSSNTTTVTLTSGTVNGNLYGGGLGDNTYAAAVNGAVTVNVNGGTVNDVYGCNNVNGAPQDVVTVNINSNVGGNVYGGGNQAVYANTPDVNMMEGTVTGSVFGGGNRAGVGGGDVTMTGGTVLTGVYGGCNTSGTVSGNIAVNIKSGVIGSQAKLDQNPPVTSDVFGGGFGSSTATNGNVEVNIDSLANHAAPIIYGNVYGGSALGNVNNEATDHTTVNVLYGTLKTRNIPVNGFPVYHGGNVFGGGLGQTTPSPIEAKVYGVVTVNIGGPHSRTLNPEDDTNVGNAVIEGNVYGCNNTNGSPQDSVTVNIYRTHREVTDQITYVPGSGDPVATYALHNVFGGGNQADYIPAKGATNKKLKVWIHDCYNSIERVFGGSNAAAAGAVENTVVVNTLIDGGRFNSVFGGGNGEVDAANIEGNVDLQIHGGIVNEFFVGSNQNGSISGSSNVIVDQTGGCEEILITEFFCGGKYADFVGDIDATITCSEGMHVTNLYGGCKEAHVRHGNKGSGNIHLRVYGGTFENVYGGSKGTTEKGADIEGNILLEIFGGTVTNAIFGGSNVKGAIGGSITVHVEQGEGADYCPLDVSLADVYGGGNQADYPGTPASDSPLSGAITHSSPYNYPQVTIKNATVRNVFGGGLEAKVTGNPQIYIKKGSWITGNVYGGGNMGEVNGDPRVIINGKLE